MADDNSLFQEIDESLRVEKLEAFWIEHYKLIIAACAGIIVCTALSVIWKSHMQSVHEQETAYIINANTLADAGKSDEAIKALEPAEKNDDTLGIMAKLRHAQMLVGMGQKDKAQAIYNDIANSGHKDAGWQNFAALQSSLIAADGTLPMPDVKNATKEEQPYIVMIEEQQAMRFLKDGKTKEAKDKLQQIAGGIDVPMSERNRVLEIQGILDEGKK